MGRSRENRGNCGRAVALLSIALALCAPAWASGEEPLNRVEFRVQVEREVANDTVTAVLAVERENVDPGRLAEDVNRSMARALREARDTDGVRVRSGNYRTWAVQEQRRIVRWRAEQELILESAEPEAVHRLIGVLQERLVLRTMGYSVSPEGARKVEDALTSEALAAFRARAGLIAEGLGASGFEIVRLQFDGGGLPPPMPMMMSRAVAMEDAPVAGEPGTSRLVTGVNAVIRLKY